MFYLARLIYRGVITVNSPLYIAVQIKGAVSSGSTSVFKRKLQDVNFNGGGVPIVFIKPCSPLHVCNAFTNKQEEEDACQYLHSSSG